MLHLLHLFKQLNNQVPKNSLQTCRISRNNFKHLFPSVLQALPTIASKRAIRRTSSNCFGHDSNFNCGRRLDALLATWTLQRATRSEPSATFSILLFVELNQTRTAWETCDLRPRTPITVVRSKLKAYQSEPVVCYWLHVGDYPHPSHSTTISNVTRVPQK